MALPASFPTVNALVANSAIPAGAAVGRAQQVDGAPEHRWILGVMESEGPRILALLRRLLRNDADVLDAYQECFYKLASRSGGREVSSVRAYLFKTASNIGIEMIRTRTRRAGHLPKIAAERRELAETQGCNEDVGREAMEGALDALRGAIAELPAHLRNVVSLRDLSGLSYEEVGSMLGISPATARVYRRHAVVKLATLLPEDMEL